MAARDLRLEAAMTLEAGTRLGPYEIGSPLGAGGMGEVYKAKDTRLDRSVAIKVLPAHLSSDTDLRARFEREARVVSSLNHPHICTLHDIGHQDGVDFLVMEYLDGETLADRLGKGALPLDQALRFGIQIADALDRAHRAGVVHRDLKPGNVILTKSGAKLLDFGLAKALSSAHPPGLSVLATEAKPLTEKGTVLGTVQYMAPEQLEGRDADARSDIFAFGSLLYEMLTGRRAFTGSSQASLIGAILRDEPPPVTTLQALTPPAVDRVVATCLAKDPDERWQSAHDLGKELRWIADGSSTGRVDAATAAPRRTVRSDRPTWAVAVLAALAAVALGALFLRRAAPSARAIKSSILLPANVGLSTSTIASSPLAISPDGTRLAFCAHSGAGADQLWVQTLDSAEARALAGTEGATQPFWSPDGRSIGFFAERKLKRVDAQGGPVLALADAIDARGGAWGAGGVILFSPDYRSPLYRVAADGSSGKAVPVTTLDTAVGETTNRYPSFLPDGKHFLYLARRALVGRGSEPSIVAASLDSPTRKPLVSVASNAAYASGHLLFMREGILVAQPFDAERLVMRGDAVPIAADARADERFSRGTFSVSTNGVLVYRSGKDMRGKCEIRRYDRAGRFEVLGEPAALYEGSGAISLSPDGSRASAGILSEKGNAELWLVNTSTGQRSRFTLDAADHSDSAWTSDGSRLLLASSTGPVGKLVLKATDGSGGVRELLTGDQSLEANSVSPDGKTVLVTAYSGKTGYDLFTLSVSGDRTLQPFVATAAQENLAQFSPNGRFVAYESDATGLLEIYVAAYPQPGDTWQVSQKGAHSPRWSKDGTELFFIDRDNWLQAASVDTAGARFEVKSIERLFQQHDPSFFSWSYDVFPDGKHFLVGSPSADDALSPIALVTEWDRKLRSP